jgi:type II secretory pathway pseudopilin PulG
VILALSTGDVVGIVIGAVVLILLLFFLGGSYALSRRRATDEAELKQRIEAADAALAEARAEDKGWERGTIEAAARAAVAPREVAQLHLIQVVDKPGTDADQAVFRVVHQDGGEQTLTLGRRDGAWVAV